RRLAISVERRPRVLPVASTTYQSRSISSDLAENVFMFQVSSWECSRVRAFRGPEASIVPGAPDARQSRRKARNSTRRPGALQTCAGHGRGTVGLTPRRLESGR